MYEHLIWGYKNANEQLISHVIESFNWEKSFEEKKNVHDVVYLFKEMIFSLYHNFVPNKIIIRNGKDPPWFKLIKPRLF